LRKRLFIFRISTSKKDPYAEKDIVGRIERYGKIVLFPQMRIINSNKELKERILEGIRLHGILFGIAYYSSTDIIEKYNCYIIKKPIKGLYFISESITSIITVSFVVEKDSRTLDELAQYTILEKIEGDEIIGRIVFEECFKEAKSYDDFYDTIDDLKSGVELSTGLIVKAFKLGERLIPYFDDKRNINIVKESKTLEIRIFEEFKSL